MEEKLNLKHLTIAFANTQKVLYFDDERELNQICRIVELREEEMTISNGEYQYDVEFDDIKIIVRPLSDLTKEIEVNGEMFVPIEKLKERDSDIEFLGFYQSTFAFIIDEKAVGIMAIPYYIIQQLIEWHFDIFNLIEKGLAVDINTI